MESLKRDNGGILILLVYVIAIVLLLGTTVMATTVMSYKMRLSNVTYVSNAYLSDAGLDEANALAILSYEQAASETIEHITEIIEGTIHSIDRINNGEKSYVLSPYREYIHPLDLTLLPDEIKIEFQSHFNQTFRDCYAGMINDFDSRIDADIKVRITRISSTTGKSAYSIESTYKAKGITRKNGVDLIIAYPQISLGDGYMFDIVHQDVSVSRSNWRVLYGQ
ncbi:MAG: hypothetical protein Q8S24_09745 [Eubacteriales bacterium]|nr:hypothetical protein [Eubacteriales bacterium]